MQMQYNYSLQPRAILVQVAVDQLLCVVIATTLSGTQLNYITLGLICQEKIWHGSNQGNTFFRNVPCWLGLEGVNFL